MKSQGCGGEILVSRAISRRLRLGEKPADAAGRRADATKVRIDGPSDEGAGGLGWPGPSPSWGKAGVHKC
jgi:hypothetical protein